jgi:hypothetical protein
MKEVQGQILEEEQNALHKGCRGNYRGFEQRITTSYVTTQPNDVTIRESIDNDLI